MILKRYAWLPFFIFVILLAALLLYFGFARQSVEVRVYDSATGTLLSHASVENLTPARSQTTSIGWLFQDVDRRLSVKVSADGYLPREASWRAANPWKLRGRLDVSLSPTLLKGQVRDAETGLPLSAARVWIDGYPLELDAGGRFQRSRVAHGATVNALLAGYRPWQQQISWQDHLLQEDPLTIDLQPNVVTGHVFDGESGRPLQDVVVSAGELQTRTDDAGRFSLSRVPEGKLLTVRADGFWPLRVSYSDQPLKISLQSDLVEGWVYWEKTGEPLAEAAVTAAGQKWITDEDGRFRLHRLEEGQTIFVKREGFWPLSLVYSGQDADLSVGLRDRRVQIAIESALEGVELEGVKVRRNDRPLTLVTPDLFELRACRTSDLVEISADGHWPERVVPCVSLPERADVTRLDVKLQPRVLTVTVLDAYADWPLARASVSHSPPQLTDAQGQVVLAPAMPNLSITVAREGYEGQTVRYDDQASEMEVWLMPQVLQGRVVDAETGSPVSKAAFRQGGQTVFSSDADGRFNLDGQARGSQFTVRKPGYRLSPVVIGELTSSVKPQFCPGSGPGEAPCWEVSLTPFEMRGVYIPFGLLYNRERTLDVLDMISETELNGVVVDIKGDRGYLAYASELPLAVELDVSATGVMDIHEFLELCRQRGIYTVARLVIFKDNPLAHAKPDLAVKQGDGAVWLDREELGWANPFREEVWAYNIGIAEEVAELGFDEIQMDYVRFPSDGDLDSIVYEEEATSETKNAAIRTFVSRMQQALASYDVFLSADVFGLTLVVDPQSGMGIGQRVIDIAPHVDYLCPMVYPSTFIPGNMGIQAPSLHPYEVVSESLRRGMSLTSTLMRPWLQAYSLGGVEYGVLEQSKQRWAAKSVGAVGWTFWNAGGYYDERVFQSHKDVVEREDWRNE